MNREISIPFFLSNVDYRNKQNKRQEVIRSIGEKKMKACGKMAPWINKRENTVPV